MTKVRPVTNKKAWTISIAASLLLVVGVFAVLFGSGYRFFVVQTPSMGTVAPVGTLVAVHTEPAYRVGDIVTYERKNRSYTHRIVDITGQGFITKGDINDATDALPVQPNEIVGLVTFRARYVGFLVQGLPWIILGWAIVYGVTLLPRVRRSWRWQIRFIGWSLVVSIVALWTRPWVNLVMMGYLPSGDGVAMHLVNTGVFPVKVLGTVLQSGQDAVVQQNVADASGHYTVIPQLALTPGWFLLLLAICLTPMLASLLIGIEEEVPAAVAEPAVTTRRSRPQYRRIAPIALTVTASIFAVALVLQMSTNAAFAASIKNSANTAGASTYFNCKNAVSNTTSPAYLAWALGTSGTTSETDLSGNRRTGGYKDTTATNTATVGCNHDTKASVTFNGTSQCLYESAKYEANYHPDTFSLEAWFLTGTKSGGVIVGFGDSRDSVVQSHWDRHIYLDKDGRIVFGVYPGTVKIVYTALNANGGNTSYADNKWHHVIATLSSAGQSLYVDGTLAMTNTTVTSAEQVSGYWKVGCGNLDSWRNAATDATGSTALDYTGPKYFKGQIQYAAVYPTMLTATQVLQHFQAGA
jgi:signal peptidase I